jgi:hypothetical protein
MMLHAMIAAASGKAPGMHIVMDNNTHVCQNDYTLKNVTNNQNTCTSLNSTCRATFTTFTHASHLHCAIDGQGANGLTIAVRNPVYLTLSSSGGCGISVPTLITTLTLHLEVHLLDSVDMEVDVEADKEPRPPHVPITAATTAAPTAPEVPATGQCVSCASATPSTYADYDDDCTCVMSLLTKRSSVSLKLSPLSVRIAGKGDARDLDRRHLVTTSNILLKTAAGSRIVRSFFFSFVVKHICVRG